MSNIFTCLNYETIDHMAHKIAVDLFHFSGGEIEMDVSESIIIRALREYYEDFDVPSIERNTGHKGRTMAPTNYHGQPGAGD